MGTGQRIRPTEARHVTAEVRTMQAIVHPVRLAGYGVRAPTTRVRGREVAGRVEAVGNNVSRLRVGDEVFGIGEGSFAEYARARADKLAPRPKNLTFEQAAAAGVSAHHCPASRPQPNSSAAQGIDPDPAHGTTGSTDDGPVVVLPCPPMLTWIDTVNSYRTA